MKNPFILLLLAATMLFACRKKEIIEENEYYPSNYIWSLQSHPNGVAWDFRVDSFTSASFITIKTYGMIHQHGGSEGSYCLPLAYIDSFPDNIFDRANLPQSIIDSLGYHEKYGGPIFDNSGRATDPLDLALWLYNN